MWFIYTVGFSTKKMKYAETRKYDIVIQTQKGSITGLPSFVHISFESLVCCTLYTHRDQKIVLAPLARESQVFVSL